MEAHLGSPLSDEYLSRTLQKYWILGKLYCLHICQLIFKNIGISIGNNCTKNKITINTPTYTNNSTTQSLKIRIECIYKKKPLKCFKNQNTYVCTVKLYAKMLMMEQIIDQFVF